MAKHPVPETRQSLLVRLRDSADAEAWQTFQDVYSPMIYRYCRSVGLQDADAADVTQEVLAQVSRSIGGFDLSPERGRFRGWLWAVVRSMLSKFWRKSNRAGRGVGGDTSDAMLDLIEGDAADKSWEAQFNAHLVRTAMDRIRENFDSANWQAFELSWLHDRSAPDVARETGLAVAAVYVAKSRILKRLREEILTLAEDVPHFAGLGAEHETSDGP